MTKLVICLLLALALTATLAMVAPGTAKEAADGPRIVRKDDWKKVRVFDTLAD